MRIPPLSILTLTVLAVCTAACTRAAPPAPAAPAAPAEPMRVEILRSWTEIEGPAAEAECVLVRNAETWADTWSRTGRASGELPDVDFETESVVAVFNGVIRAIEGMGATLAPSDDGPLTLAYDVRGTSGVLSPEVHPWGFYVVPRGLGTIRVECHHRAGPGPADITVLGTLDDGS